MAPGHRSFRTTRRVLALRGGTCLLIFFRDRNGQALLDVCEAEGFSAQGARTPSTGKPRSSAIAGAGSASCCGGGS
jgi:hypothetical protein